MIGTIVNLLFYPWVLLGLIPIFVGLLLPLEKERVIKKEKNRKVFWKVLLVIGILPFAIPLLISFISAIFGLGLFYAEGLSGVGFFGFVVFHILAYLCNRGIRYNYFYY